ncbi:DNA (cytosine-5)-methyltransferase DRM2-like [Lolium rigidum]|uniref:DNA (cytosine-5)-methyltransferase DRM2-like n=1 Tax=Lolium rigidum TaxID=89674 RepID=UPI001F5D73C6|nr:DNA (cytosine-5)-methyltransferase DRM2-like [Lolium rigidum]
MLAALSLLKDGLLYPNVVAVSRDRTYVAMAHNILCQPHMYYLEGQKAGQYWMLADLPGYPDNHGGSTSGRSAGDGDGEWRPRGIHLDQHGAGSSGLRAGDGSGERRPRGFQLGQHGPGSSGLRAGDGDGEWRPRGIHLDQHGAGSSGLRAGDGDGEWRPSGIQHDQHGGGPSGLRAGDGDGERRARRSQLGQPRGLASTSASTAASAWTTGGWNGATKPPPPPPPPRDVSERPGSSRQDTSYLARLMVAHFIEMGFPAEKVAMALEHAGRGGGGDKEADVLQWLLDQQKGSSRQGATHLTSPMATHFIGMGFSAEEVAMATHFTGMGFSAEEVAMALENARGGRAEEAVVLQWLFDHRETDEGFSSSIDLEGFSSSSGDLETFDEELTESEKFFKLVEMGFTSNEASAAITRCGGNEPLYVLADAVYAAQIGKIGGGSGDNVVECQRKRRRINIELLRHVERASGSSSRRMVGFGVPNGEMDMTISRKLPGIAEGPPYFYFENVACALRGVWDEMSRSLYNIEPEYVDSKYFCVASRKRGYIHNLPIAGRFPLLPIQSRTIKDAFPRTTEWWPQWDKRERLNCIQTVMAPATASKFVRKVLTDCDGIPSKFDQKKILDKCRQWNLIWVGPKTVATLDPDEVELLMGFPKYHTRSFTNTERYKSLGNSFQKSTKVSSGRGGRKRSRVES